MLNPKTYLSDFFNSINLDLLTLEFRDLFNVFVKLWVTPLFRTKLESLKKEVYVTIQQKPVILYLKVGL